MRLDPLLGPEILHNMQLELRSYHLAIMLGLE